MVSVGGKYADSTIGGGLPRYMRFGVRGLRKGTIAIYHWDIKVWPS